MSKKTNEKLDRTEMITFRATPYEKELIEELATQEGIKVSQYLVGLVLRDFLISGNLRAMNYAANRLKVGASAAIRGFFFGKDSSGEEE